MTCTRLPTLSYHSKCCNFSLVFLTTYDKVYMPRPGRFFGMTTFGWLVELSCTVRRIWSFCVFDQMRCASNHHSNPNTNTNPNPNPNPRQNLVLFVRYSFNGQPLKQCVLGRNLLSVPKYLVLFRCTNFTPQFNSCMDTALYKSHPPFHPPFC